MKFLRNSDGFISKIKVVSIIFALFVALEVAQNIRQKAADSEAREAGWVSAQQQEIAAIVGCKDKACYDKYKVKVAEENALGERDQQQLEPADMGKAAERSAEAKKQLTLSAASKNVLPSRPQSKPIGREHAWGQTMDYWREACARLEEDKRECSVADSPRACIKIRIGEEPEARLSWCQEGYWNNSAYYD